MKISLLIFLIMLFSYGVFAQPFWVKKEYTQWSRSEIEMLASNSPWSQLVGNSNNFQETAISSYFTVRLRSALPIRQSIVRLRQFEERYDKMNEKQKADFDARMQDYFNCRDCQDHYVINIAPPMASASLSGSKTVQNFMNVTFEQLKNNVYLISDKGARRPLVRFIAPTSADGEAVLFFSRYDEKGSVLLKSENKWFSLIFEPQGHSFIKKMGFPNIVRFNVGKMIIDGKVEF